MKKKNTGNFYIAIGIIWSITGLINVAVSSNYLFLKTSMGVTYTGLAVTCMCLAILYISLGIKKRKNNTFGN